MTAGWMRSSEELLRAKTTSLGVLIPMKSFQKATSLMASFATLFGEGF